MRTHRGQALVEGAVTLVLLSTVLAAIPVLAGYHDVQRAALRAARDASYMAGWAGMGDRATLTHRTSAILSDVPWTHPANGERWLSSTEGAKTQYSEAAPPGRASELMDFIARPLGEAQGLLGGELRLSRAGYRALEVVAAVPAVRGAPPPFSGLSLQLTERAFVLTESWNAGTPAQVIARVEPLVPSARLAPLVEPMRAIAAPLQLLEPAFAQLCVGRIEPDRIPEPRLGPRVSRARGASDDHGSCK
jgi:hypothetical protein